MTKKQRATHNKNKVLLKTARKSSIQTGNYKKALKAARSHPLFIVEDGEVKLK